VLFEPVRNVDIGSGYNGAPRGGGDLCGGSRCLRDGLTADTIRVTGPNDKAVVEIRDADDWRTVYGGHYVDAQQQRKHLLAENPPIKSGTELQIGCHHAEMNVICNAAASTVSTAGAWLVITGEPCLMCAKLLHHAGIVKVICVQGGYAGGDAGPAYLRAHGVEVEYIDGPSDPRGTS
jgi:dCMP deaminase